MRWTELITRNWALKLAALILAILLWAMMQAPVPSRQNTPGSGMDTANFGEREPGPSVGP